MAITPFSVFKKEENPDLMGNIFGTQTSTPPQIQPLATKANIESFGDFLASKAKGVAKNALEFAAPRVAQKIEDVQQGKPILQATRELFSPGEISRSFNEKLKADSEPLKQEYIQKGYSPDYADALAQGQLLAQNFDFTGGVEAIGGKYANNVAKNLKKEDVASLVEGIDFLRTGMLAGEKIDVRSKTAKYLSDSIESLKSKLGVPENIKPAKLADEFENAIAVLDYKAKQALTTRYQKDARGRFIGSVPANKETIPEMQVSPNKLDLSKKKIPAGQEALGAVAGFEMDENGNLTYNPEKGALGVVAIGALKNPKSEEFFDAAKKALSDSQLGVRAKQLLTQSGEEQGSVRQALKQSLSLADTIPQIKTNASLNVDNLNIPKEAKNVIKTVVEDIKPIIQKKTGDVLSNKKIVELADNTSQILSRTVGEESTKAWEAAMLKARQEVSLAAKTGTIDQHFVDTLLAIKTQGTDIARKLQSLSIKADPKETTYAQTILNAVLDVNKNVDEITAAAKDVDFNDFQQAASFYRKFVKPSVGEWLDLLRYNSMLSAPKTHIVNAFSNGINSAFVAPVEQALTGGVDFIGSKFTGNERKYFAGESGAYLKGYFQNASNAFKNFSEVLSGKRAVGNLDVRNVPLAPDGGVKGAIEKTLSLPLRLLEASDQFFTALAEGGERGRLLYRQAKVGAVSATELATKPSSLADYRLYRQELFPEGQGYLLNAIDELTSIIYQARNSKNPLVSYPVKFSIPFIRTPMNIFKQGIEYSPTGFFTAIGAAEKSPQIAKALMGTAVAATAGTLLASNRLSWAEPSNEMERNAYRAAGIQPYSIKLGDKWVSYQKLPPPLAFPISMIALVNNAVEQKKLNESTGEMILSAVSKYGEFLADQSYAKNFGDLLEAVQGGESAIAKLTSNYPQQLIPYRALGGWLSRLVDDVQRKPDPDGTFIEKQVQLLMMNIPGLSGNVPARKDAEGNPIQAQNPVINAFSPASVTTENEKAKEARTVTDIKKQLSKQSAERTILTQQAEVEYARLMELPKEEARAKFDEMAKSNPALAKKVGQLVRQEQRGLTASEKLIDSLGVENGERAQRIYQMLNELKTDEEKRKLWEEYTVKGIITKEVAPQIIELMK